MLEQLDGRALQVGEAAARLDCARGRGRIEQAINIGLCDIGADCEEEYGNDNPGDALVNRVLSSCRAIDKRRCPNLFPVDLCDCNMR